MNDADFVYIVAATLGSAGVGFVSSEFLGIGGAVGVALVTLCAFVLVGQHRAGGA